jgi:hypothetical protein
LFSVDTIAVTGSRSVPSAFTSTFPSEHAPARDLVLGGSGDPFHLHLQRLRLRDEEQTGRRVEAALFERVRGDAVGLAHDFADIGRHMVHRLVGHLAQNSGVG